MSSASKDPANETPLAWRLQSDDGLHLRADATDAGRLVLLSDALRWLMDVRELPRSEAIETLCHAFESTQPAPEIFRAQQSSRAEPITGDEALFGYHTEETWACMELGRALVERRRRYPFRFDERSGSFGSNGELTAAGWAAVKEQYRQGERPAVLHVGERAPHLCEPGIPAAARYIREHWSVVPKPDVSPQRWQGLAYGLAVRLSDAWAFLGCNVQHGSVQPLNRSAPLKVEPPAGSGWTVHSAFGALKTAKGERLIRLQDVHAWLMQRDGLPSASIAARVLGVFVSDANSKMGIDQGVSEVRKHLYLTDLSGYAEAVPGFAGQQFLQEVAELVPYIPHHRFDRGSLAALMYSLGLMAGEVWAPHACDLDVDERLEGYSPCGSFPTAAKCREIVGRLAVPFALAHELWGWGTVLHSVESAGASAKLPEGVSPFPLADFAALVRYRLAQKAINVDAGKHRKNVPWDQGNQLDVLHAEYERLGQNTSAAEAIAKNLRITRQAVESALGREWERPSPNRWGQLGAAKGA